MSAKVAHPTGCGERTEATKAKSTRQRTPRTSQEIPPHGRDPEREGQHGEPQALGGVEVPEVPPEEQQLVVPPAGRDVGRHLPAEGVEDAHHETQPHHLRREERGDLPPRVPDAPALEDEVIHRQADHARAVGEVVTGEQRDPGERQEDAVPAGARPMQVEVDERQRQSERDGVVPALPQVEEERHVPQREDSGEGEEPARSVAEHPPGPEEEAGQTGEDEGQPRGEGVAAEEADERRGVEVLERGIGAVLDPGELEASAEGDDVGPVEGVGVAGPPDVGREDGGVGLVVPERRGTEVDQEEGSQGQGDEQGACPRLECGASHGLGTGKSPGDGKPESLTPMPQPWLFALDGTARSHPQAGGGPPRARTLHSRGLAPAL